VSFNPPLAEIGQILGIQKHHFVCTSKFSTPNYEPNFGILRAKDFTHFCEQQMQPAQFVPCIVAINGYIRNALEGFLLYRHSQA
jgi:hypothetical protein